MRKNNKTKKDWKVYNSDINSWNNMMLYYKWCACIFCLLFALILLFEKIWILSLAMFIFSWYFIPLKIIREYDCYIGKIKMKIILYANIILTIIGIYLIVISI